MPPTRREALALGGAVSVPLFASATPESENRQPVAPPAAKGESRELTPDELKRYAGRFQARGGTPKPKPFTGGYTGKITELSVFLPDAFGVVFGTPEKPGDGQIFYVDVSSRMADLLVKALTLAFEGKKTVAIFVQKDEPAIIYGCLVF